MKPQQVAILVLATCLALPTASTLGWATSSGYEECLQNEFQEYQSCCLDCGWLDQDKRYMCLMTCNINFNRAQRRCEWLNATNQPGCTTTSVENIAEMIKAIVTGRINQMLGEPETCIDWIIVAAKLHQALNGACWENVNVSIQKGQTGKFQWEADLRVRDGNIDGLYVTVCPID